MTHQCVQTKWTIKNLRKTDLCLPIFDLLIAEMEFAGILKHNVETT